MRIRLTGKPVPGKELKMKQSDDINRQARDAALVAVANLAVEPTGIIRYASRGVVVVIGDQPALQAASIMPKNLDPYLLLTDESRADGLRNMRTRGRKIHVDGYLGHFSVLLDGEDPEDRVVVQADTVLDLSTAPLLNMPLKPPGYVHSGTAATDLQAAVNQLADLTGTFEKPKYFDYDASICAHGRSGKTVCTRCIDACPADAIRSAGESVEVEPHLCQGGGVCATTCPSGAIRYVYPPADDTLAMLRKLLHIYRANGGRQPVIVFHNGATGLPAACPGNVLPVAIEELASVGIEVWLSALAYGAGAVLLLDNGDIPARVSRVIDAQLVTAREILSGMGYPAEVLQRVDPSGLDQPDRSMMALNRPAGYAGAGNKRQTAFLAIDALHEQMQPEQPESHAPLVALTAGAPFGTAEVDAGSCTLCLACVSACPGRALQSGQDTPQLRFIEANCLQCGTCMSTCPEDAIFLTPRLLLDPGARKQIRTLYEEPPFCCVSCGKPFATRSVIDEMMAKLEGHWMFTDERARRRLMMCEDCRVIDVVQDPAMMDRDVGHGSNIH
jgi:ferredoxin